MIVHYNEFQKSKPHDLHSLSYLNVRKRKISGSKFLKEGISSLLSSYSSLAASTKKPQPTPSLFEVVKMLKTILKIYDDMDIYLHPITIIEDPSKHDIFIALQLECRVAYLCFQIYHQFDEWFFLTIVMFLILKHDFSFIVASYRYLGWYMPLSSFMIFKFLLNFFMFLNASLDYFFIPICLLSLAVHITSCLVHTNFLYIIDGMG